MTPLKTLALWTLLTTSTLCNSWAAGPGPAATSLLTGEVLEMKDVESYTYLRLKTQDGETWAAVGKAAVKTGSQVRIENPMVMANFESKALHKTFKTIVFGNLVQIPSIMHMAPAPTANLGPIKVAKASGANTYTVAELISQASSLKDKAVTLRGQVVKFNPEIMGKNWIHLQDGSGSAAAQTHDLLVTSRATAQVGDVVTVSGTVRTNQAFAAGYSYKVMLEDALLTKP